MPRSARCSSMRWRPGGAAEPALFLRLRLASVVRLGPPAIQRGGVADALLLVRGAAVHRRRLARIAAAPLIVPPAIWRGEAQRGIADHAVFLRRAGVGRGSGQDEERGNQPNRATSHASLPAR